jgi:drug/metabolite transporter (DMT)-like permease
MLSFLAILSVMVIWAGSFIFIKFGISDITPLSLSFWRFIIATPLLIPFISKRPSLREIPGFIVLGISGVSLLYYLQFTALLYTTPTNASILINTAVIFIAAFSAIFFNERLKLQQYLGILVAFAGIVLVISEGKLSISSTSIKGDLMMIANGLLWAIYTVYGKKFMEKYSAIELVFWSFVFGVITLTPFVAINGLDFPSVSLTWVSILYLSVLCSGFAYVVWYHAVERLGAAKTSVFIYLIPLFTAMFSATILGEVITAFKAIGGFLTIVGLYMAEK